MAKKCTVHSLDAKAGGAYKMSFTNFSTGKTHSFGGKYVELVPGQRIVATDVTIVQEGIPAAIPPDGCCLGWQESLAQLAKLVEPKIPDGV